MNIIPSDTTVEAVIKQFEILQRMGIEGRAEMTFQLNDNLRSIVEAGVRHRHPEFDDKAVRRAVFRLTLGEHLFREVFGNAEEKI